MAYNYLLELYTILEDTRLAEEAKKNQLTEPNEKAFHEGMMDMARELEVFLETRYNRMLPRKIRERLEKDGVQGMT